ncbi:molybdenum cofactor guanylyltransferase MobA [Pusillimonas sp.]|uniref:molybdenum cofactor guanylyltransferase MobA n=1 Tax=Pusillimonas sp. TaxID=3040095 RepID=UPI0037C8F5B8
MIKREDIDGLILAGGRSRRMRAESGPEVDKGLLELDGALLVQRAARFLEPVVSTVYVSANRSPDIYGRYGRCIPDDPIFGGDAGPLAGVASVMAVSRRRWLLVSPVDVPRPPSDLPQRLAQAVAGGAPLAYAFAGGRAHPLCMLASRELSEDLRAYLLRGGRKVLDWHERHGAVPVDFGDDAALFSNINTPADWQAAGGKPAVDGKA